MYKLFRLSDIHRADVGWKDYKSHLHLPLPRFRPRPRPPLASNFSVFGLTLRRPRFSGISWSSSSWQVPISSSPTASGASLPAKSATVGEKARLRDEVAAKFDDDVFVAVVWDADVAPFGGDLDARWITGLGLKLYVWSSDSATVVESPIRTYVNASFVIDKNVKPIRILKSNRYRSVDQMNGVRVFSRNSPGAAWGDDHADSVLKTAWPLLHRHRDCWNRWPVVGWEMGRVSDRVYLKNAL